MESTRIHSGPIELNLYQWKSNKPKAARVLALHGFTGDGLDYKPLAEATQDFLNWYTPDLMGHGQSDSPKDLKYYLPHANQRYLNSIEKHCKLNHYILMGYSMGGRAALNYAIEYPEKIAAVVLISTNPGPTQLRERRQRQQQDHALADRILNSNSMEAFMTEWLEQPIIATQKNIAEPIRLDMLKRRYQNNPVGLSHSLRGFGTGTMPTLWHRLDSLACPVLIVSGSKDIKYSVIAKQMAHRIPCAERASIRDAGHCAHLEQPQDFCRLLKNFIQKH